MSTLPFARLAADGDYLVIGPGVESGSFKLDNPVLDFSATEVLALQTGTGRFVVTSVTGGTGDVVGPVGATDNALARYDGATGTVIQNSVVTLSDAGALAGVASVNGAAVPSPIGDVVGPVGATDDALARYDGATGTVIQNSAVTLSDAGALAGVASVNGAAVPSPIGDVVGPASATDNALARYDGATGTVIQNSAVTLSDAGALAGVASVNGAAVPSPFGDVVGPVGATDNSLARYDGATGKAIQDSVVTLSDAGALAGVASVNGAPIGDVVGPAGATDNALARYDGATGTVIQNSAVTLSDAGALAGVASVNGAAIPSPIGDVVGPGASNANTFAAYADTTGKLLTTSLWGQNTVLGALTNSANNVFRVNTVSGCFVGTGAPSLAVAPGSRLTTVGASTGGSITVGGGANTTLVGALAGQNITSASNNTLIGESAGRALTTASGNTAVGSTSLTSSVTGTQNTAIGAGALSLLTTGTTNIGVGSNAGISAAVSAAGCIFLGHTGAGTDTLNVMRLGTASTASTFVTGVNSAAGDGVNFVTCATTGQMGVSRLPWSFAGSIDSIAINAAGRELVVVGGASQTTTGSGTNQFTMSYNFDLTSIRANIGAHAAYLGGTLTMQPMKNNVATGSILTQIVPAGAGWYTTSQAQAVSFAVGDTITLAAALTASLNALALSWEMVGVRY